MPGFKLDLLDIKSDIVLILERYNVPDSNIKFSMYINLDPFTKTDQGYSAYRYFKIIYALNKHKNGFDNRFRYNGLNHFTTDLVDKYLVEYHKTTFYDKFIDLLRAIEELIDMYVKSLFGVNLSYGNITRQLKGLRKFTHPQIKFIINYIYSKEHSMEKSTGYYYFLLAVKNVYGNTKPKKLKCSEEEYSLISQNFVEFAELKYSDNIIHAYKKEMVKMAALEYIMELDKISKDLKTDEVLVGVNSFKSIIEMPEFEDAYNNLL